jgi:hypothetical protein
VESCTGVGDVLSILVVWVAVVVVVVAVVVLAAMAVTSTLGRIYIGIVKEQNKTRFASQHLTSRLRQQEDEDVQRPGELRAVHRRNGRAYQLVNAAGPQFAAIVPLQDPAS